MCGLCYFIYFIKIIYVIIIFVFSFFFGCFGYFRFSGKLIVFRLFLGFEGFIWLKEENIVVIIYFLYRFEGIMNNLVLLMNMK